MKTEQAKELEQKAGRFITESLGGNMNISTLTLEHWKWSHARFANSLNPTVKESLTVQPTLDVKIDEEIRESIQEGLEDYTLKSNNELITMISNFGCGELEFHTADIERVIRELIQYKEQKKSDKEKIEQLSQLNQFKDPRNKGAGLVSKKIEELESKSLEPVLDAYKDTVAELEIEITQLKEKSERDLKATTETQDKLLDEIKKLKENNPLFDYVEYLKSILNESESEYVSIEEFM